MTSGRPATVTAISRIRQATVLTRSSVRQQTPATLETLLADRAHIVRHIILRDGALSEASTGPQVAREDARARVVLRGLGPRTKRSYATLMIRSVSTDSYRGADRCLGAAVGRAAWVKTGRTSGEGRSVQDPTALFTMGALPAVDRAVLVQVLDGFVDAGHGRRLAREHLLNALDSGPLVSFDVDQLVDYGSQRPEMTFTNDHWDGYTELELAVHRVRGVSACPGPGSGGFGCRWMSHRDNMIDRPTTARARRYSTAVSLA
jgi:hypothetical protein